MTWTKLSDDFSDECWTLSDGAFRLLVEMLNYSNRKLLDCRIPKDEMRLFAKRPEAVAELTEKTYIRDLGNVYEIAFHSLYQPTREQVLKVRDRNVKNGRKGGRPKRNPDGNPDGFGGDSNNPLGNPDGNPQGRDGTGRAIYGDEVQQDEVNVNSATGEVLDDSQQHIIADWYTAPIPDSVSFKNQCRVCGQAVKSLDAWGLCSKVSAPHVAARKQEVAA